MSSASPADKPIDPASAPKGRRRLVPDLTDTIEVGGERLARVVRAPEAAEPDAAAGPQSLEDVIRRHVTPEVADVAEKYPELLSALAEAEQQQGEAAPPERTPREVASRIELFSDGDVVVPHPEADAQKREGVVSLSPVIGLDDAPERDPRRNSPETLFDLFSMFPELDGVNQTIRVERKEPKNYTGLKVAGWMRDITRPITLAEWQEIYGGGTYRLYMYGMPKRGGTMNRDGRMNMVRLADPITFVFPGTPSGQAEVYASEEEAMNAEIGSRLQRGPASIADASIVKEQLAADLKREERQENREKSKDERLDEERKKREQEQVGVLHQVTTLTGQMLEMQAEFRREQLESERAHHRELRERDEKWEQRFSDANDKRPQAPDQLQTALEISKSLNGDGKGSTAMLETLRGEHTRETERLQHQIKEERDRADARIKDAEARADARVKDHEQRTASLERDLRERSDREVTRVKEEADRRINDLQHQHTTAMAAETRNHERDLNSLKAQHAMLLESQKGSFEMRLETARGEVKRTQGEADRYKSEAEDNKDVVGKLKKLKEDAQELGMVEAADNVPEPQTVVQMLTQAGAGLFQQLPSIIESVSSAVKTRSNQEVEAARAQARSEMVSAAGNFPPQFPPPHRRRAPELGGEFGLRHMSEVGPAPVSPGHDPLIVPLPQQHFESIPVPHAQPAFQQAPPPMPVGVSTGMPPEMRPLPAPTTQIVPVSASQPPPPHQIAVSPSAPPPPPPSAVDPAILAEDRQIANAEVMVLPHYNAGVPPGAVADAMLSNFGVEEVRKTLAGVDADRVILAISRVGSPDSPFLRRDGKKYLRALFLELRKKAG